MILKKIETYFENIYPKKHSEEWDNVGLILGDRERQIKKILIAIDADEETVERACQEKVDLIITHHPMIFSPIKKIDLTDLLGRKINKLIKNDIAVYTMHTNIDASVGGLNEYIMERLGANNYKILDKHPMFECGIGRYYKLENPISLLEYIKLVKDRLNLERAEYYGNSEEKVIKKIAVVNGAGASYWRKAKFLGVDLLVTGDVKYHDALDGIDSGISFLDIGHYEGEKFFMELIEKQLREFNNLSNGEIEIVKFEKKPLGRKF